MQNLLTLTLSLTCLIQSISMPAIPLASCSSSSLRPMAAETSKANSVRWQLNLASTTTAIDVIRKAFNSGKKFTVRDYIGAAYSEYDLLESDELLARNKISYEAAKKCLDGLARQGILQRGQAWSEIVYTRIDNKRTYLLERRALERKKSNDVVLQKRKLNKSRRRRKQDLYFFRQGYADGSERLKHKLGAKGARLAEMAKMNMPVPPGFTISTRIAKQIAETGEFTPTLIKKLRAMVNRVEKATGSIFGDSQNPLFLSVRSGGPHSMPGILRTITNIGFNDITYTAIARRSANPECAANSRDRFLREFTRISKVPVNNIPEDPFGQLLQSIKAVASYWNDPAVVRYRKRNGIPHHTHTAINVEAMVFGNMSEDSATGVAFSRNPINGQKEVFGEVIFNAQGEDLVASRLTPNNISELEKRMPKLAADLKQYVRALELHYKALEDVEFTIQQGKLYILQSRDSKISHLGLVIARVLIDYVKEGLTSEEDALKIVTLGDLLWLKEYYEAPVLKETSSKNVLLRGLPASPGTSEGIACFSREKAMQLAKQGEPAVLLTERMTVDDDELFQHFSGVVTNAGGATSHAAILARSQKPVMPAIVGAEAIQFQDKSCHVADEAIRQGDRVIIDGNNGILYAGRLHESDLGESEVTLILQNRIPKEASSIFPYYERLLEWINIKTREMQRRKIIKEQEAQLQERAVVIRERTKELFQKANSIMRDEPEAWRDGISTYVTNQLCNWLVIEEEHLKFSKEEIILTFRYMHEWDPDILAKVLHAHASNHDFFQDLFNRILPETDIEFGFLLFNLLGTFNLREYTSSELREFRDHAGFPLTRILAGIDSFALQERYIQSASEDTLVAIIEEMCYVREAWPKVNYSAIPDICEIIAQIIIENPGIQRYLFGIFEETGVLSEKAQKWLITVLRDETDFLEGGDDSVVFGIGSSSLKDRGVLQHAATAARVTYSVDASA
ncbi:PEP/pyruvate-binding domain-containing protein [Candidatus Omnitrophota bacterium]